MPDRPRIFHLDFAAKTDRGLVRDSNQDAAHVEPRLSVAVVADGMGGHASGDVASALAVRSFVEHFGELGGPADDERTLRHRVSSAIEGANDRVHAHPAARDRRRGMGTTLIAAAFSEHHVAIGHVGDSRCYRWRRGTLSLVTRDHSYANMLRQLGGDPDDDSGGPAGQMQHVLLKAVGRDLAVEADVCSFPHEPDDVYLLCSDGLWGSASEPAIAAAIGEADDARQLCKTLVGLAWAGGGLDNIGIAVVRVVPNHLRLADPSTASEREPLRGAELSQPSHQGILDSAGTRPGASDHERSPGNTEQAGLVATSRCGA